MSERIHTYFSYDGETGLPEEGIADFGGRPHYFWLNQCTSEPHCGLFDLAPADVELFAMARELEAIWHEWDLAYHAGKKELKTHPLRSGNNPRYVELSAQVSRRAEALRSMAKVATGVISTSAEYLARMQPFAGKKWPVPGTYSLELEGTWREAS